MMKERDIIRDLRLHNYMSGLRIYKEEHKLFLDLEDEDVKKKYWENYPNGTTDSLDFRLMICGMIKDKDIFKNKVIKRQMMSLKKDRASLEIKPKAFRKVIPGLKS